MPWASGLLSAASRRVAQSNHVHLYLHLHLHPHLHPHLHLHLRLHLHRCR
jgi:hypothetical protein